MMWKFVLAIAALLSFSSAAEAAFAIFQTASGAAAPAITTCDITTGACTGQDAGTGLFTAATCNGIADDRNAFNSWNTFARATTTNTNGQLIELFIPPGKQCMFLSGQVTNNNVLSGLKNSRLMGYGASFAGANGWALGPTVAGGGVCQRGIADAAGCSARIATVSAGATSVTLLNTALCSRFTTGLWAMVTGFDLQGAGFPPNPNYLDFVQITSTVNCATTGQITFNSALTYDYFSTWPLYSAGTAVEADQGGPATIYALGQFWGGESDVRGLTIDGTNATKATGRKVTFTDVTVTGTTCIWPGENQTMTYTNLVGTNCNIEVDKLATNVVFNNLQIRKVHTQSSSVINLVINGAVFSDGLYGTPKNFTISNATLPVFQLGPIAYGVPVSGSCTNCVFGGVLSNFGNQVKGALPGFDIGANVAYSVSGGVFSIPSTLAVSGFADNGSGFVRLTVPTTAGLSSNYVMANGSILSGAGCGGGCPITITISSVVDATHVDTTLSFASFTWTGSGTLKTDPPWWAAPGSNLSASSTSAVTAGVPFFQTTGVTQNATHTLIATTLSGGYPNVPFVSGKSNMPTQAPKWTCTNCTGTAQAVDFSGLPANIPIFSRTKRSYTNSTAIEDGSLWGQVTSITINVTTAYTGATNPLKMQFVEQGITAAGVFAQWVGLIDLRTAGTRVITPSGVTCNGVTGAGTGCGTDSGLALPDPGFMFGATLNLSKPNGSPVDQPWAMDYDFVMNQGVVP